MLVALTWKIRRMIGKVVDKYSSFIYLVVILSITISFKSNAYAEDHHEEGDHFDGSEYNASTFSDDVFEKTNYKELSSTNPAAFDLVRASKNLAPKEGGKLSGKHGTSKGVSVAGGGSKNPIEKAQTHVFGSEHQGPVMDLAGDWVPDSINLTCNGGFEIAPNNGAPVPYRLNGHVDIQRGRP